MKPPGLDLDLLCDQLAAALGSAAGTPKLKFAITNEPLNHPREMALLFLGFICFYLVDDASQTIYIASVSDNEYYKESIAHYNFDPSDYRPALDDPKNIICKAIREQTVTATEDWDSLSRPEAQEGAARLNQASAGIGFSQIHPLDGGHRGALMYSFFQYQKDMDGVQQDFMERYTKLVADVL